MLLIGVDIGGTKCAACLGEASDGQMKILHKCAPRKTAGYTPWEMLERLSEDIQACKSFSGTGGEVRGTGISCGGPLNSAKGIIQTPPNLPGWDNIPVVDFLREKTGLHAWLCNDANACALAEWTLGAGKGCQNMVFLTFGTGLGAGLILNGRLYTGANDMAGEAGHIRLSEYGPAGYGKIGSFEGFCSGGGIAQLAKTMVMRELQMGNKPPLCPSLGELNGITAEKVGAAAKNGDMLALEILRQVGTKLGRGLSILVDLLNPEKIVIGSIFSRCYDEIWPWAQRVLMEEALPLARDVCRVVPSGLSESVGDLAALVVARYYIELENANERPDKR